MTKACPSCGEKIQKNAKKCKHCKSDLRNWFVKHWIITIFLVLTVIGLIGSNAQEAKVYSNVPTSENQNDQQNVVAPSEKFAPINLSGNGQQASEKFTLPKGLATFKMKYSGQSHFSIFLLDGDGDKIELLVNEIGGFDGSKAVKVRRAGTYLLDVSADAPWSVVIE